jgi:hypothetical protein
VNDQQKNRTETALAISIYSPRRPDKTKFGHGKKGCPKMSISHPSKIFFNTWPPAYQAGGFGVAENLGGARCGK